MSHDATASRSRASRRLIGAVLGSMVLAAIPAATAAAQLPTTNDPRFGLTPGLENAGTASLGITHLANRPKPAGLTNTNADAAFQGNYAFVGNYNGITSTTSRTRPTRSCRPRCPAPAARTTCRSTRTCCSSRSSPTSAGDAPTARRRRPRRASAASAIFDISDISSPQQIAAVQTCRGSHTHTLVRPKTDPNNVYIYVSGTAACAPAAELAGLRRQQHLHPDRRRTRRLADRDHQGPARQPETRPRSSTSRACSPTATAPSTACRTPRRRRIIRARRSRRTCRRRLRDDARPPNGNWSPSRSRTPATTSRSTRSSTWPPAPARATAS